MVSSTRDYSYIRTNDFCAMLLIISFKLPEKETNDTINEDSHEHTTKHSVITYTVCLKNEDFESEGFMVDVKSALKQNKT